MCRLAADDVRVEERVLRGNVAFDLQGRAHPDVTAFVEAEAR